MSLYYQLSRILVSFGIFIIFILSLTDSTFAQTINSDLDQDGILDHEDLEVIVSTNQQLSTGEYIFHNITINNGAQIIANSDPSASGFKGVKITAENLTIESGSSINADGKGYGSDGPGSPTTVGGASYGGAGERRDNDSTYGSAAYPTDLGSGGFGNFGGGAIQLVVLDTLTNNGLITTNGLGSESFNDSYTGGSGGSVYIITHTLTGSGAITANGADMGSYSYAAAGGGGRIAIYYDQSQYTGTAVAERGRHFCGWGCGYWYASHGTVGYFNTTNNDIYVRNDWIFQKQDSPFEFNKIYIFGGSAHSDEGVDITVTDSLEFNGGSFSTAKNQILNIPQINVRNGGILNLGNGETIHVDTINLENGSKIVGSPMQVLHIESQNITIDETSAISADMAGYPSEQGPGYNNSGAGSSHGGLGEEVGAKIPEPTYGSEREPTDFGSGGIRGDNGNGGYGGGSVRIISDSLMNNGTISANAGQEGASGGSVYVTTNTLSGSGSFSADGGNARGYSFDIGAGGGGRVAVYYRTSNFTGTTTAKRGDRYVGGPTQQTWYAQSGTTVFEQQNTASILSFVNEDGYVSDTESPGVHPNKGTANLTYFTFKVNYTSAENKPPIDMKLILEHAEEDVFVSYKEILMFPTDGLDTDYTNGSEYYITLSLPRNYYRYHFEVTDGTNATHLPEDGSSFVIESTLSNVAFLPGMQASRLYRMQTYENQLWEPNRNEDIEKLYLSPTTAESLDKTIYTRDLIDQPNVDPKGANIYKSFMNDMNDLVNNNVINAWKGLPYDWRLDLPNILSSGIPSGNVKEPNIAFHYETQTPYILEQLQALVDSSDSGNVTLIAHSNGGLIAKYLLAKLEEGTEEPYSNYPNLLKHIDRVILVASPQIGTPLAIESMLHGDESQLTVPKTDFGILVDEERVRGLAENMMTAYNLLPSKKYFELVNTPVIEFGPDVDTIYDFQSIYGSSVDTQTELTKFLLGDNGLREKPESGDEESPNVLGEYLLDRAIATHNNILDSWVPPSHIQVIQVAGTGLKTVSGIKYDDCDIIFCPDNLNNLDREILMTSDGDGTVVEPSALVMEDGERTYIDIHDYNGLFKINRDHASILEIDSLRTYIERLIQGQLENNAASGLDYLSKTKPESSGRKTLDFEIHSPVALHIYDNLRNHTGIVPNTNPESDIRMYERTVPNSYYTEIGEEKYAGVSGDNPATLVLRGENNGTFTFVVKETENDVVTQTKIFASIPVTADTIATMKITSIDEIATLQVDIDGDGSVDASFEEGVDAMANNKIAFLKGYIPTLGLNYGNENVLIQTIKNIERMQSNKKIPEHAKIKSVNAFIHTFILMVNVYKKIGYISDTEAKLLTDTIVSLKK